MQKLQYADQSQLLRLAVRQENKWAILISNNLEYDRKVDLEIMEFVRSEVKRIYGLTEAEYRQTNWELALSQGGMLFFDTEYEMERFYEIFSAPIIFDSLFYALSFNTNGDMLVENIN